MNTSSWQRIRLHFGRSRALTKALHALRREDEGWNHYFGYRLLAEQAPAVFVFLACTVIILQSWMPFGLGVFGVAGRLVIPALLVVMCWGYYWSVLSLVAVPKKAGVLRQSLPTLPLHPAERAAAAGVHAWSQAMVRAVLWASVAVLACKRVGFRGEGLTLEALFLLVLACVFALLPAFLAGAFGGQDPHDKSDLANSSRRVASLLVVLAPAAAYLSVTWSVALGLAHVTLVSALVLFGLPRLPPWLRRARCFPLVTVPWRGRRLESSLSRPGLSPGAALARDTARRFRRGVPLLLGLSVSLGLVCLSFPIDWSMGLMILSPAVLAAAVLWTPRNMPERMKEDPSSARKGPWERLPIGTRAIGEEIYRWEWIEVSQSCLPLAGVMVGCSINSGAPTAVEALAFVALCWFLQLGVDRCGHGSQFGRSVRLVATGGLWVVTAVLATVLWYFHEAYALQTPARIGDRRWLISFTLCVCCTALVGFALSLRQRKDLAHLLSLGLFTALLQWNMIVPWTSGTQPWVNLGLVLAWLASLPMLYRLGLKGALANLEGLPGRDS